MNIDHGKREWTSEELDGLREALDDAARRAGIRAGRRLQPEVALQSGRAAQRGGVCKPLVHDPQL